MSFTIFFNTCMRERKTKAKACSIRNNRLTCKWRVSQMKHSSMLLPCHQHLGSCRGGIPLLVSGMPEKHKNICISQHHRLTKHACLCNITVAWLKHTRKNLICRWQQPHMRPWRHQTVQPTLLERRITLYYVTANQRSVSVVSYIPHLYNISWMSDKSIVCRPFNKQA